MAARDTREYIGRFAPSPTGPLHFGSLLAAIASYLEAKSMGGAWFVRMEDIDPPREQPGAATAILRALEAYGFAWDGAVRYQSRSLDRHLAAIGALLAAGHAYRCGCSRRDLAALRHGPLGAIYPGTCRAGTEATRVAIRVRTDNTPVVFHDLLQGRQSQSLEAESGDFVVQRRDGLIAYQLAVVVDDFEQGITQVVRGIDLLDSTPRQVHVQRLLGYPTPDYAHIPVVLNARGQKLGKTTGARAIPLYEPRPTLIAAFKALGQPVPPDLASCNVKSIWSWARENWSIASLTNRRSIPCALAATENGLSLASDQQGQ
ncbi:MAG: tRNA glutamyl-Q(34) synthetase GluQRS [Woeseiaceae bacterium]